MRSSMELTQRLGGWGVRGEAIRVCKNLVLRKFLFLESNKKVVQFFLKLLDILPKYPQYQFLITIVNKLCPLQCKYNVSYILV